MVAGMNGSSPLHRIRTPNAQDVLSGRGGGINSHKGNKTFREWVNQRKEEYNLAQNKKEKIAVAMQIVHQVHQQSPPGRFLQRDTTTSGQWWVEISEAKALAKTTQALREGAPKIRQILRNNNMEPSSAKKRKRKAPSVAVSTETPQLDDDAERLVLQSVKQDVSPSLPRYKSEQLLLPCADYSVAINQLQENAEKARRDAEKATLPTLVAPLTSNKVFKQMYGQNNPLAMPAVDPFAETPPLMAAPEPDVNDIPILSLDSAKTYQVDGIPPPPTKRKRLPRVHSLALSDVDGAEFEQFVNPFADESNVLTTVNDPEVVKAHVPTSVLNQWSKNVNGSVEETTENTRSKKISIGTYLNRLLSFSSTTNSNENSGTPLFKLNDENTAGEGSDYFFLDDDLDFETAGANDKNSSNNLLRRASFSLSRGLLSEKQ